MRHNPQSFSWACASSVLLCVPFGMGWCFGGFGNLAVFGLGALLLDLLGLLSLVLWIVLMVKAFQGVRFKVPWVGELAERLAGGG
jgi:uncharacterized membrane protein